MIRTPKALVIALAFSAPVFGLVSCVGGPASLGGPAPLTPTSRYSLQVENGLDRIAFAVHEDGLSTNQNAALSDLARRFAVSGAEVIVIEAPAGGDPVAVKAAYDVHAMLERLGLASEQLRIISYTGPDPRAPVLVGFETIQAAVPRCGTAWGNLSRTGDNRTSANFGCAVTANLAAQIADPRDIVAPRALTPADAGRRSVVFDNYRAGRLTAAPQETLVARTRVSTAVE
ncbi:CpaD family pilus assembly protein [Brevundimonas sp.]|jgi:pilus assembly protein CpaD|uniref:CpaD family pilus assembly protein n=1 Tax=Brevundimonas sp. TaxID=1871086 RepID=UPI00180BEFB1|nr:CpaD family pilus assembly protein [Brevundimonas sp.]MBA4808457.1 CpaD family pilus assembly protein [Brevundimonas sp.]